MTLEAWLDAHPYLRPLARLSAEVSGAAARSGSDRASVPVWDDYAGDFETGLPLLRSSNAGVDLEPAGKMIVALVEGLSASPLPEKLAAETSLLATELRREPDASSRVAAWLLGDEDFASSSPGLLRYLGWSAVARYLAPLVEAFDAWRGEERWVRRYCPTCGSLPVMAQLIGVDPGRKRFLCCGCCGTRWRYPRTGCPFCEQDSQRLAVVAVGGEESLRIDHCESCRGYLKTYNGQGREDVFLSDWTSLHLDVVARDRGLKRLAASLYEIEPALVS